MSENVPMQGGSNPPARQDDYGLPAFDSPFMLRQMEEKEGFSLERAPARHCGATGG